jgi:hypothetical protein
LADLRLLGLEVQALEAVLLGDVVDVTSVVDPEATPPGVVTGLRCGSGSCTLFLVNLTPEELTVQLKSEVGVVGTLLAPFGVAVLSLPPKLARQN